MTAPAVSYDQIRAKSAELIREKLFHPDKDNKAVVELSREIEDLWSTWVDTGDLEGAVNR